MLLKAEHILLFLEYAAKTIAERRDELTALDAPIGDADHGTNLDRGFSAVIARLQDSSETDLGILLRSAGTTLLSTVGGSSGPLYGTAFMRMGAVLTGKTEATPQELLVAFEAGLQGVMARGKAQAGEKTMIDAIEPAVQAFRTALEQEAPATIAFRRAAEAALAGAKATIPMLATKGRASYLGERSIGHQDPGATSAYYLIQTLADVIDQRFGGHS